MPPRVTLWHRWHRTPLYKRILIAMVLGMVTGLVLGPKAEGLVQPSSLLLRLLGALAPALVLVAIVQALIKVEIGTRAALRLCAILLINTLVAIIIGMLVVTAIQPGSGVNLAEPAEPKVEEKRSRSPVALLTENVPKSLVAPFVNNQIIGVIIIAVAFGVALRRERRSSVRTLEDAVDLAMRTIVTLLGWVISIVPLAVFGVVASEVGLHGFADFTALAVFVGAVLAAFLLQALYYMLRVRVGSWVKPLDLLRGTRDALVMAFSTASSTATIPVTYACVKDRVGVREQSASLGVLVGSHFTHDGTGLYTSMGALFVAQLAGADLSMHHVYIIILTSVFASLGAAGIPQAGVVMMSVTLDALGLPTKYIAIILTVDWFLDRCETVINVLGHLTVTCLVDGKHQQVARPAAEDIRLVDGSGVGIHRPIVRDKQKLAD